MPEQKTLIRDDMLEDITVVGFVAGNLSIILSFLNVFEQFNVLFFQRGYFKDKEQ